MQSTRPQKTRKPRTRDITVAPSHVSQTNCLQIAGIDPLRFLELLRQHPELPRTHVGKLRVVALDDLRALLDRLSICSDKPEVEPDSDDAPTTADDVLRAIGRRSV
jgi:hypothetical protein